MKGFFYFALMLVLSTYLVSATILTDDGENSFSDVPQNATVRIGVSVENTANDSLMNLTKIMVVLPNSLSFVSNSNSTDASPSTFSVSGRTLNWSADGLIMNGSTKEFLFNVTAYSNYSVDEIEVSAYNATGIFEQESLSIEVIDTVVPLVTINEPEEKTYSDEFILLEVSINEDGLCLYSDDGGVNNFSMNSDGDRIFSKRVSFDDGGQNINFYCRDNAGNWNVSESIFFRVDYGDEETPQTPTQTQTQTNTTQQNLTSNQVVTNNIQNTTNSSALSVKSNSNTLEVIEKETAKGNSILKWVVIIALILIAAVIILLVVSRARSLEY